MRKWHQRNCWHDSFMALQLIIDQQYVDELDGNMVNVLGNGLDI